jgi:predicted TIM-barrel fold metal-dependent hydrolase
MAARLVAYFLMLMALEACRSADPPAPHAGGETPAGPPWRPGYERPPVIDVHAHIYPDGLGRLEKAMVDNGLAMMINLSGGDLESAAETQALVAMFPRMLAFFNVDWRRSADGFGLATATDLEKAVKNHGFRGLKIPKVLGLYLRDALGKRIPVDWPELDPLWKKAGELGVPVAIHTADPKAFWLPPTPDNERYEELSVHPRWSFHGPQWPDRLALLGELENVFRRHPETTFISVHFGNNAEDLDDVDRVLDTYPNVYIDTAARLGELGRHPPEKVRAFFIEHKTRILFGTDIGLSQQGIMLGSQGREEPTEADIKPFYDAHWRFFEGHERGIAHPTPIQGRWTIDAIDLPDDVLEHLYWKNAARLLAIDPKALGL